MVAKLIFVLGEAARIVLAQLSKVAPEVMTSSTMSTFLWANTEGSLMANTSSAFFRRSSRVFLSVFQSFLFFLKL